MDTSNKPEPFFSRWWQTLVILFGLLFLTLILTFHPFN